jgi:hypothetical protein
MPVLFSGARPPRPAMAGEPALKHARQILRMDAPPVSRTVSTCASGMAMVTEASLGRVLERVGHHLK